MRPLVYSSMGYETGEKVVKTFRIRYPTDSFCALCPKGFELNQLVRQTNLKRLVHYSCDMKEGGRGDGDGWG